MDTQLLVVLPFHAKDEHLAVLNLEWAISLDKAADYTCLIVCPSDVDRTRVEERADLYFDKVEVLAIDPCPEPGWPRGKNWAWQNAVRHIYATRPDCRWLWWEPDAIPTRKGWIAAIFAESIGQKRILSPLYQPLNHTDAVAVYDGRIIEASTDAMLCRAAPFEQVAGAIFSGMCQPSKTIQSLWDINGKSPSFKTRREADKLLKKNTVLFHRCKDGSLTDVLSQSRIGVAFRQFFATSPKIDKPPTDTCIVMLGRYGDIINDLPVAWHLSQSAPVTFMACHKFIDVLQGVNYVTPLSWAGDFTDVTGALAEIQGKFKTVLVGQVNGRGINLTSECDSFAAESWRQMGQLERWSDLPLVFDNRNAKREKKLWAQYKHDPAKKTLLVNFSGFSSPYPFPLEADIIARWSHQFEIIDLSKVKAQRIYDLLGLFDRADLLITIDTATTHLAYGSSIPVINLVTDKPTLWHGARPRGNSILALRYAESWIRRQEIHSRIETIAMAPHQPSLGHVFSDYTSSNSETTRRMNLAKRTWSLEYRRGRWMKLGFLDSDLPRMFRDTGRELPYLRDLIRMGLEECETIILTNADICVTPAATTRILDQLRHTPVFYSRRRDFARLDHPLSEPEVQRGRFYVGADLFGVTRQWWQDHANSMPDMLIGAEAFDAVLCHLMETTVGRSCCGFDDLCYHEKPVAETSFWELPEHRYTLPSQRHNLGLAKKYFTERGLDYKKWGIR